MAASKQPNGRVVKPFKNALDGKLYQVGMTFKGTATEVRNLSARGFLAPAKEVKPKPASKPKAKSAEKATEPTEPAEAAEQPEAEQVSGMSIDDIKADE